MSTDQKKIDAKRKELERKGWSEKRIAQYLKDWSTYKPGRKSYGSW